MKIIVVLFLLIMSFIQGEAQVIFSQDFENGNLSPMIAVNRDTASVNPHVANLAGPTWSVFQKTATNKVAVSTSWLSPITQDDDWLISPAISVPDSNTFLSWEAVTTDPNYRDGYEVRISTSDTAISSFSILALTVPKELTTWTRRSLKLNLYVGQTIYFAFRNNSIDVDNIRVEVLKNTNVRVKNLVVEKYNHVNDYVDVQAIIENHGALPVTSCTFGYQFEDSLYSATFNDLNIAPLSTRMLTHSIKLHGTKAGEYPFQANISNVNGGIDEDPGDNVFSRYIYFLAEQLQKKVVIENICGTWCMWCPRGIVYMEKLAALYPEWVIPIEIHYDDPMAFSEYVNPLIAVIGGYPAGHLDRKILDVDPEVYEDFLDTLYSRAVPVEVGVEATWDEATRALTVKAKGHLSITSNHNSLRFSCVLTENNVHGTDSGYEQYNVYSGGGYGPMGGFENLPFIVPADQMLYQFVARAILGGFDGMENSIPDKVVANKEFEMEFTYIVPEAFDINDMNAIVIALDSETGEILNSARIKVTENVGVPSISHVKFNLYPNPATEIIRLEMDGQVASELTLSIYDPYGRYIRSIGDLDVIKGKQIKDILVGDLIPGQYLLEIRDQHAMTAIPFTKI